MLSHTCQQFREGFTIDGEHSHLDDCSACRTWAEQVVELSRCRLELPLPAGLHSRLVTTVPATPATGIDPLPQLPVPVALQQRLLAIPYQQAEAPPSWFLKVRYGVAASLLLTFVSVSALGSTINRGHKSALSWSQRLDRSLQNAKLRGQEALTDIGEATNQAYQKAHSTVTTAPDQISSGWTGLSTQLIELFRELGNDIHQKEKSNGDSSNDTDRPE
jgi:hypothetical protein